MTRCGICGYVHDRDAITYLCDRIATLERERAEMIELIRKLNLAAAECLGFQSEECGGHLPRHECITNAADVYDWTQALLARIDTEAKR